MCGRAYSPNFVWMWPNAKIAVMGGEQAAGVLVRVRRDALAKKGETLSDNEAAAIAEPILDQFAQQSDPFYASARLWDDGIIDPRKTRAVLSLSLAAAAQGPKEQTHFPVFRF